MKLNLLIILIVLVFTDTQAKKQRKWRPPLEFGPRTTSIYSSLQRSNRRKINVDLLDHYDDRTKPPRVKLSGSSYKPGTWNWYPNLDIPNYSYRFKIFNLTKDQAGSYIGMHDYRKNYGPLYNTRFGGTYPPIPPLLGDPRQPRLAWYLKQYTPPTPPTSYIDHVMDTVKDGQLREKLHEKQLEPETNKRVSAEWYTVRPKNESNYFHEEDKIKPRFGDYGGIALEDAFPAYKPKEQYEVVMVPERQPIYKRSAEAEISISVQKKSKESKSEEEEAISISFQEKSKESMSEEKEKPKKRLRSEPYSSHSYTYEQFNSNESISGPFTAENQLSSSESKSSSSIELESTKTKHSREKRSTKKKDKSDKKSSDYTEISSELHVSKSASFPAALNTGESGWGAKPPASKSTESGSDSSKASKKSKNKKKSDAPRSGSPTKKKKKSSDYSEISSELHKSKSASTLHTGESGWAKPLAGKSTESSSDSSSKASQKSKKSSNKQKSNAPQSGYPDHSYPRMKPEDDSDKERVSSGLENESFPSASSSAHSSDMVIWDAMRNYSREFKSISSTSDMVSSGDLSKYGSDSGSNSKEKEDPKKGKKNQKNNKKSNIKSKKSSVKGNTKKEKHINLPAKETLKQKLADDKDESGSNYDSDGASAWADVSYVSEITVDPPHLRTFPPTFTEQYVMPLHHQPDDFWDEIYRPDGPEPTLYPWQEEEEKRKKATTTWKPPIITTRDPTSKPKFIYITNEESTDEEDRILESSQQKNKGVSKQHGLGSQLTKTQLQLRQILKFKNKAKGLQKRKVQGIAKNAMNVKGKDKRKKDKKKPKKKDKDKKYNPNNFSRPNPDVLKVQGKHDTQPMMDNPLHNGPKKGNVVGDPLNNIQKGEHKIEEPYLTDPRKIYAAVTPFEPDYSFSEPRPEGNYEWPSLKHPLFNPETAYDEEGFPIHESPDWTSPTTHRKDRIFGKERNQISSGVRGQRISMSQGMKRSQVTEDPNMARLKFVRDHNRQMHVTEDPNMARLKFVRGRKNKMLVKAGLHPEPVNNQVNAGPIIAGLHPDLTHNQVNAGPLPDLSHNQMIAGPLPDLTHNQDVKTLLHPSLIKDKKIAIAKNSKILHNKVVDLPNIQIQPAVVYARQKRDANAKLRSSSFSEDTGLNPSQRSQDKTTYPKGGYTMNQNTMFKTSSNSFSTNTVSSTIYTNQSTFVPTTTRPQRGLNVTRDPFVTDEYYGNYNEKWGFTKKMSIRSRPPWWTRAPFYITKKMFDPPPGFVYPPGPTKLFWPGLRVYKRIGPKLPKSTYPPVWFRTGRTNFPHTLPPQRPQELKTTVTVMPVYRHVDSFELGNDPPQTVRIRTGKTHFPHTVYPFVKEALWGKVKLEDRESFTYPTKWLFDDLDDDFLLRSKEVIETNKPSEAKAATAWMNSSMFVETTLERPEKDKQSIEENLFKKRSTFPPIWIRTGRTIMPQNVSTFVKKALWGKVKPEDRESFTNTPVWMLDYEDFLLAKLPTEEPTTVSMETVSVETLPQAISTLHTAPWWTYPAYWIKRHPHLNITERLTTSEPLIEEGPAEWTRPPGMAELCPPEDPTTTRRSFVFDILRKRKKEGVTVKKGIKNQVNVMKESPRRSMSFDNNRRFSKERHRYTNDNSRHLYEREPPRYPSQNSPRHENHYPPFANDRRNHYPRDHGPRYNQEYPRHFRDRPRYEVRNPASFNDYPRYGRGNSRFSRQNMRQPNYNARDPSLYHSREGPREEQTVTYRNRFRYRPKRSTSVFDNKLLQFLFSNKYNSSQDIQEHMLSKNSVNLRNSEIKTKPVQFRPETLWQNLGKESSKEVLVGINNNGNVEVNSSGIINSLLLQLGSGKYIVHKLNMKNIDKRFIDNDDFYDKKNKRNVPDFDFSNEKKKKKVSHFDFFDKKKKKEVPVFNFFDEKINGKLPDFDFFDKQKKGKGLDFDHYHKLDELLRKEQEVSSSSGSGSQSLASLIRSFESDEEKISDVSSDYSRVTPTPESVQTTKFKWVQRKWAGMKLDKSESDLSELKEPTTYFPKREITYPKRQVQMRKERRTKVPNVIKVPFKRTVLRRTTPKENLQRRKRDLYDDIDTTEPDPFFEAWLKSKREEEERERLLLGLEYGLTTPDYLNEPLRSAKAVRKRGGHTRVIWVAKTKRPKVYTVPFILPDRLNKKAVTLKGRLKYGRKKKGDTSEANLPIPTTLKPITIDVTEHPGYFKFGKRIYWLTPRITFKPTWLRPRRLKPLTTATTTELPSPKYATLINIYRTTEKPTVVARSRRTYRARTFRTLKKLIVTTKPTTSESDDLDSDDIEGFEDDDEDILEVDEDEDELPKRSFPTLKLPKRKKQEVISFREYLQRRENLIREKEENMWNAQFTPESEEDSTTVPPIILTLPTVVKTLHTIHQTSKTLQTNHQTSPTATAIPVLISNVEPSTPLESEQTTYASESTSTAGKRTRRTCKSRKPRATRRTVGTKSKRGRVRKGSDNVNIFPTMPFSDTGRTKRELLTPENELFEVTTEGNVQTLDSVFETLNKQKIALQEAFFQKYEIPTVETTTFEYNIDNLCQAYNIDYGKTSRSLYLKNLCIVKNITVTTPSLLTFPTSYYSSVETNSSDNIVKRSVGGDRRIILNQRMRSVSKQTRRIPIDLNFNNSGYTDQSQPNFDLYNARRSTWFNTTLRSHPRINFTNYEYKQPRRNIWKFKHSVSNLTTYTPNFKQYFKNKHLWFNRTNDMHYNKKIQPPRTFMDRPQRWHMKDALSELQTSKKETLSSRFQKHKAKLKQMHSIPNLNERDIINQRYRWGDKEYIPKIDRYTVQKILNQPENPDQSIVDRENELARQLHLNKRIPVHMSLLEEVSDPDLMDRDDYLDVKRYKPPHDFLVEQFGVNKTYDPQFQLKTHRAIKIKKRPHFQKEDNMRAKQNQFRKEFYEANGDYRKYPNLDAMKQRRVLTVLEEPVVDDSEVMIDFTLTTKPPITFKTDDRAFEKFLEAQINLTTEATKFKMMDEYNRTYIHDVKSNRTYYPQHKHHIITFSENETDSETYDKYLKERQNYYNLSMDIIFTHYVFSTMKHDNITCTYGRMSNIINRWYNKTFYPLYRSNMYGKKYNIAVDRNYVQLLKNLEAINELYQSKIKLMDVEADNITSKVGREKDTVTVKAIDYATVEATERMEVIGEKMTVKPTEKIGEEVTIKATERMEAIVEEISGELLSAEAMKRKLLKQEEIRRKEFEEQMKMTTTTISTPRTRPPLYIFTLKTSHKPTTEIPTEGTEAELITEEITKEQIMKTEEITTTTEAVKTTRRKKATTTEKRKKKTTTTIPGIPDFKLTLPPTKPTKKPQKSFFKKLLSKIKPMEIIKSWFSWGKAKEKPEK